MKYGALEAKGLKFEVSSKCRRVSAMPPFAHAFMKSSSHTKFIVAELPQPRGQLLEHLYQLGTKETELLLKKHAAQSERQHIPRPNPATRKKSCAGFKVSIRVEPTRNIQAAEAAEKQQSFLSRATNRLAPTWEEHTERTRISLAS